MRIAELAEDNEHIRKIYEPDECELYGWTQERPPVFAPEIVLVDITERPEVREWLLYREGEFIDPETFVTLDEAKRRKKDEIASMRYAAETGGITVGGVPIATDDRSKGLLFAAYGEALANPAFADHWKGADGIFRPVDAEAVKAIYAALRVHIASCFAREAVLTAQIDACSTKEDVAAVHWGMDNGD